MAEKRDCSNIFVFMEEWERRRKVEPDEEWYGLTGINCYNPAAADKRVLEKTIEELQKWSDEHPRQTRKEKFIQICKDNRFEIPSMDVETGDCGYPYCVCDVCGGEEGCEKCKQYWDSKVD